MMVRIAMSLFTPSHNPAAMDSTIPNSQIRKLMSSEVSQIELIQGPESFTSGNIGTPFSICELKASRMPFSAFL